MLKFNIKIKGKEWEIRFLTKKQYEKAHGDDSAAITVEATRQIDFLKTEFTSDIARHELTHGFFRESNVESAGLSGLQIEELAASIVGEYAIEIVSLADYITNKFLGS